MMLTQTYDSELKLGLAIEPWLNARPAGLSLKTGPRPTTPRVFTLPRRPYWRVWGRVPAPLHVMEQGEPSVDLLRASIFTGPTGITVVTDPRTQKKVLSQRGPSLGHLHPTGIDLAVRGVEVRKLFYAAFARGLVKDGYDPEEALQEVYRGLLTRNNGTCPFDVTKSSFGHYVHIVARCVLANYIRKERRRTSHEMSESSMSASYERDSGGSFSIESCPDIRGGGLVEPGSLERLASRLSPGEGAQQVAQALSLLTEGYSRREVAQQLGVSSAWMTDLLKRSRELLSKGPELS